MKVLILTNSNMYDSFRMWDILKPFQQEHQFYIYVHKVDSYPEDYDIGISFMYQHKVPKEQIEHRPWINFHPAPLPEYRGRNLCYHAIMNGEKEFGTTVHYMDENFDTGEIIDCFKFQILESDTSETLSDFAINQCKTQFQAYLPDILAGKVFEATKNKGGTYYKKSEIMDTINLKHDEPFSQFVRAVTYKEFYPKIVIGGVTYKVVRE